MADLIITPSLGKIDFIHQSAQAPRVESIILHEEDGLVFTGKISASSVTAPLNVINVTAGSSNVNYPFIFASSGETGAKSLLMDSAGGTYNPSINTATIDISGNAANITAYTINQNLGTGNNVTFNRLTIDGGNYVNNYFQSLSDFVSGTLVTTDIPATEANGLSFVMNVVGKSYNTTTSPFNFSVQGYLYNSTIINYSGLSLDSTGLTTIKIFENGGFLCFWWARVSYWNAFEVSVRSYDTAKTNYNRVTNITDVVEPTGTKKVTVTLQSFLRADVSATNSVDLRAPRFYDSENISYYADPAGTSNLLGLTVTNTITGNISGTAATASYANALNTANSYTIAGLTVNGNFAVNGSLTVFSASNVYITSSNLTVTDNILLMNALTPYQRYAGIQMYDSGSGTLSQFLWDGEGDYFFLT